MNTTPQPAVSRAGVGVAALILAWRLLAVPLPDLWKDVLLAVALFGVARSIPRLAPHRDQALLSLGAYLLVIHALGQAPHVLTVWGIRF